jgi:UDP-N-acetylenolpyruvoylglucosamine reductase
VSPSGTGEIAERLRDRVAGRVLVDARLDAYTTFRVGGPADILLEAESEDDLRAVAETARDLPMAIVGRGSNLLVSDDGFRGIAVRLGRVFRRHGSTDGGLRLGGAKPNHPDEAPAASSRIHRTIPPAA